MTVNFGAVRVTAAFSVRRRFRPQSTEKRLPDRGVWALRAAAIFALLWSVFRAIHQSITLDEADTYLWFGGGQGARYIWYGFPNNHVLNSLLIWLTTHLFGVSTLSVRVPALLGATVYVSVALFLCRAITVRFALQFAVLICLIYNPFILDYFAAARGYSLANAFLIAALAVPFWHARKPGRSVAKSAAIASTAIGLSFCANFAFAFVNIAGLLVILVWALRQRRSDSILRVLVCCVLPGLAVALAIGGYPITHYERQALWYGAHSLRELANSLTDDSLYKLCEPLASSEKIRTIGPALLLALFLLSGCRLLLGMVDRTFRQSTAALVIASLSAILALTVGAHYLAFRVLNLPLPLSRTAIYFIPLLTLLVALIAASPAETAGSRWIGCSIAVLLFCVSAHYLLCLRYTHFKEYIQAAEVKEVYRVLERLNRMYGVQEFTSDGAYVSPLNFCRRVSKTDRFPPLVGYPGMVPAGKTVYIISEYFHAPFIEENRLAVVYRGPISHVVIAVPKACAIPPTEPTL